MKILFTLIILTSSVSQAAVDYMAIGKNRADVFRQINWVNSNITRAISEYNARPTCENLEAISSTIDQSKDSPLSLMNFGVSNMKNLAKTASANDPVHAVIKETENKVINFFPEVDAIVAKARLQEIYTSQCLFSVKPSDESILENLCK